MTCKITIFGVLALFLSAQLLANDRPNFEEKPPGKPKFSMLDTNNDGDINFEEFSAHKLPHGDHQHVFDMIDTDHNGIISQNEFKDHKPPRPPFSEVRHND